MLRFNRWFVMVIGVLISVQSWSQEDLGQMPPYAKRTYVSLELLGMSVAPVPSMGLALGIGTNERSAFELSYSRGYASIYFMSVGTSVWMGKWRLFVGRSPHFIIGLGQRRVNATFGVSAFGLSDKLSAGIRTTSLVSELGFGNSWRMDHLVIGCDWISWLLHIQVLESKRYIPLTQDESDVRKKDKAIERIFGRGSLSLLKFYVGYQF